MRQFKGNMRAALERARAGGSLPKAQKNIPGGISGPPGPVNRPITNTEKMSSPFDPEQGPFGEPFGNISWNHPQGGQGEQSTIPWDQIQQMVVKMAQDLSLQQMAQQFYMMFPPSPDVNNPQNDYSYKQIATMANNMLGPGQQFTWKGDQYRTGQDPDVIQQ